ncbi:MAG: MFS transporter, partial [Dehalococcoidia bacterium]
MDRSGSLTTAAGSLRRRGLYYGWYVVLACNVVAFMTWGVGVFNQGVFLAYFSDTYGWSRFAISLGPTLFYVWGGVVGIAVGRLIDRRGPRPVLVAGAFLLGGGAVALGVIRLLWQVYPAFILLATGYAFLHTVTLGAIVSRWFIRGRARAMAAATVGASFGGMVLAPLNAAILEHWGGAAGGITLGVLVLLAVLPVAFWVIKSGPEVMGLRPDGDAPSSAAGSPVAARDDEHHWTPAEAARTRTFWVIVLSFHLVMIAQAGFLIHQVLFLQSEFGLVGAATVVTVTGVMGVLGRLGFVAIGNRRPPRTLASEAFLLQAAGLLISALGDGRAVLIAGSAIFGLTMGVTISLQPVLAAEAFGRRSFGRIYGPIYFAIQQGSAIGPLLIGLIAAWSGSYRPALLLVTA